MSKQTKQTQKGEIRVKAEVHVYWRLLIIMCCLFLVQMSNESQRANIGGRTLPSLFLFSYQTLSDSTELSERREIWEHYRVLFRILVFGVCRDVYRMRRQTNVSACHSLIAADFPWKRRAARGQERRIRHFGAEVW